MFTWVETACPVLSCLVASDSLRPHGLQPTGLLCSWGFSRQEYWNGLPCPHPGNLPNPGIKPRSPILQADALLTEPPGKPKWNSLGLGIILLLFSRQVMSNSATPWTAALQVSLSSLSCSLSHDALSSTSLLSWERKKCLLHSQLCSLVWTEPASHALGMSHG